MAFRGGKDAVAMFRGSNACDVDIVIKIEQMMERELLDSRVALTYLYSFDRLMEFLVRMVMKDPTAMW